MSAALAFVSSPDPGFGVGLDLNSRVAGGPVSALQKGTSFPPPKLNRQISSSLMRDGETITAASFANRIITVRLAIVADAATAAGVLGALNAQLDATRNWLRYKAHPDVGAVAFRTWRAPDYEIDSDWGMGIHLLTLTIPADPAAVSAA